jgi:hypothetical protein
MKRGISLKIIGVLMSCMVLFSGCSYIDGNKTGALENGDNEDEIVITDKDMAILCFIEGAVLATVACGLVYACKVCNWCCFKCAKS